MMQHCTYCGADIPQQARFCGNCGRTVDELTNEAREMTRPLDADRSSAPATPPFFGDPSRSFVLDTQTWQEDVTMRGHWPKQGQPPAPIYETTENHAVGPDTPLPFTPLIFGQAQAGNAPMVQGTPQVGGIPSIQGTPSISGGAPSPGTTSPAPQSWNWQQPPHDPHPVHQPTPTHHPMHHPSPKPTHHPVEHPTPPSQRVERDHDQDDRHEHKKDDTHHRGHHKQQKAPRHRGHHTQTHNAGATTASKAVAGIATKWIILVVTVVVVIATSGIVFVLAAPTELSLSGSSTVSPGGTLHLHGKGFIPGGNVTFTLDNGLPTSSATSGQYPVELPVRAAQGASEAANTLQMLEASLARHTTSANASIVVGPTGSFDIDIMASSLWAAGEHTLHANEGLGSRSTNITFTILPKPARLAVNPAILDFGSVQAGRKVVEDVLIGNEGGSRLTWSASIDGSNGLKLRNPSGAVDPNSTSEPLYVMVDAGQLKVRAVPYTATLSIHSNGGDAKVMVSVKVILASSKKQAQLVVNPPSLDLGQLAQGQQVINSLAISNGGNLALKWSASVASNTNWLVLSTTSGTIQSAGISQTIQVIVVTSNLQGGSYSATITISSNGGQKAVPVTLTVNAPQLTPTPGRSPTLPPTPPAVLTVGPSGFNVPGDPNCTYTSSSGWTCTASLGSVASARSNLNWTASASGITGVTFTPASGVVTPGQTAQVAISIPNTVCPATATFTFQGPANSVPIVWSCAALTLAISKSTIIANTDCTFSSGWTCPLTLATGPNEQGELGWAASSSGIAGIAISPPSGILAAGQTTSLTIAVPGTACPASATLTFTEQGASPVAVPWSCSPPGLVASNPNVNANTNCTFNNGWTCTETLSLASKNPGDPSVNWSASGSGVSGISFSPATGTLSQGQTTQVAIAVPNTTCPASASFTFGGPGSNPAKVSWSCTPSTLIVNTASLNGNTNCNYSGGWTCTETLSLGSKNSGDPSVNWSASGNGVSGIIFSPASGTLSAGQSTSVTITIPGTTCPASASFTFSGSGANPATASWSCTPPTMQVSTGSFNIPDNNCSYAADQGWACAETLSLPNPGDPSVSWSASGSGINGVSFSPANGTLSSGQPVKVTVTVPDTVCPAQATLNFAGQGANTQSVSWNCKAPGLTGTVITNPCIQNGNGWTCTVSLTLTSGSQGGLNWTSSADISGVVFSPASGTLFPGQTVTINGAVPPTACPGTFTFSFAGAGGNIFTVNWHC